MMILLDAHVHIYSCFDLKVFFDSAFMNFKEEAVRAGHGNDFTAILILTDWSGNNWFQRLVDYSANERRKEYINIGTWTFRRTNENCSLYARRSQGEGLYVIAGQKIITAENLEVLALATNNIIKDGLSLGETILSIKENDAIPVIPWAVGKWMGRRGKVLSQLLQGTNEPEYFLCDNGNRPNFWSEPNHFEIAETKGIRILSGSDPLHFASEVERAGSFGIKISKSVNKKQPARDLKNILFDPSMEIERYGNLENPYRFFRNQLAMQILKRKWKGAY